MPAPSPPPSRPGRRLPAAGLRGAGVPRWRRSPLTLVVLGLVAFDVIVVGGLAAAGLPLLPDPPPAPPPPAAAAPDPEPVAAPERTPAERVLDAVAAAPVEEVFGPVERSREVPAVPYGSPVTRECGPLPEGAVPLHARARQARLAGTTGVTTQVWVYGAGQGPAALATLEESLRDCSAVRVREPEDGPGVERLLATRSGGDGTAWLVTRRGDVLAATGGSALTGAPPVDAVSAVGARVDALLAGAMTLSCPRQDDGLAAAARNPFGRLPYRPLVRDVPVTAPEIPVQPLPPPVDPPRVLAPSPRPFPDLAPYLGQRDPAAPDVLPPRGAPPVLVDPDAIPVPSPLVRRRPAEPERPVQPREVVARVPEPDRAGPGCGWAFTGQRAPLVDEEALEAAATRALDAARLELTAATARWQEAEAQFLADYAQYQADVAAWTAYQRYAALREDAEDALAAARRAAVPPPPPPPPPPPTPTPSPTASPSPSPPPSGDDDADEDDD